MTEWASIEALPSPHPYNPGKPKDFKETLISNGYSSDLSHENLVVEDKELKTLNAEIKNLQKQLSKFCDLPTDSAKVLEIIAETKAEFKVLEESVMGDLFHSD